MRFLKTLFSRSAHTNRRSLNKRTKTLSLESLEQRIALDASGVRAQLELVREVHIDNSLVGPDPMVFGKSELVGHGTKSFVITAVAAGSTVEKWDAAANQWRDVSTPPTSSNPRHLLQLLQNRIIKKDDQVRWIPKSTDGVTQKAFEIIGWDDGSETTEPEGVNVPGAVENLEIELVGDEVRVTWDPPTTGAAVTHYRIHQNPTTVVPSTQTSHTFAKVASPASYAVTVHANSAEGAGEAMTVTLSHGSYVKNDGTVVDPILDTSGNVLDYDGPNLKPNAKLKNVNLKDADLDDANLTGATLSGATLTGADLTGADLTGATLYHVKSGGITKNSSTKLPTRWQLKYGYLLGPLADLRGADLTSTNLTNVNLTNANLNGADLGYANLINAFLVDATFNDANLYGAQLSYAILLGAELTGADLNYADLTYADLNGADLNGATLNSTILTYADLLSTNLTNVKATNLYIDPDGLPPTLPTNWQLMDGYLIGAGADLTGANLKYANLTGMDLTGVNLTGADLTSGNLSSVNLTNANLNGANLNHVNMLVATLNGATLTDADLNYARLNGADLLSTNLTGANLTSADLADATLTNVKSGGITVTGTPPPLPTDWQLINGYLIGPGADLRGADLTSTNLTNVNLTNANLNGANLTGADLTNVNLNGANLTGATLTGATLTGADLTGADLSAAILTIVKSGGITFDGLPPTLPTNWQLMDGYLIGAGADLTGANLKYANLTGMDLSYANLTGANLKYANLTGADLSYANLTGANLTYVNLTGADLTGTDLTNATLSRVKSGGITGNSDTKLPTNWQLTNGYLIGQLAKLNNADLSGATLTNATLTNATLTNADLTNADLTSALVNDATLDGTLLTGATLKSTYFVNANLDGAILTDAHLNDANLHGATLTNANLENVRLTGADLTKADLSGANLTSVSGGAKYNSATILPAGFDPVAAGWTLVS